MSTGSLVWGGCGSVQGVAQRTCGMKAAQRMRGLNEDNVWGQFKA